MLRLENYIQCNKDSLLYRIKFLQHCSYIQRTFYFDMYMALLFLIMVILGILNFDRSNLLWYSYIVFMVVGVIILNDYPDKFSCCDLRYLKYELLEKSISHLTEEEIIDNLKAIDSNPRYTKCIQCIAIKRTNLELNCKLDIELSSLDKFLAKLVWWFI